MTILYEERSSDSPFIAAIMRGRTVSNGSMIRPAESHWYMVFARHRGKLYPFVIGPWTTSGVMTFTEGAEILWIKFRLGAFIPHLPASDFLDSETILPDASSQSFWLKSSAWHYPDFENAGTFVRRLVREDVLALDPVVNAALQHKLPKISPRTLRHHFKQATGLTQKYIRQMKRAQGAALLLQKGASILDTVYELGYFDQPHMTRAF